MLRIDLLHQGATTLVKLEGRLVGPLVGELVRVLSEIQDPQAVLLELEGLSHADEAGLAVLRSALAKGARISSVSGFVAYLLWGAPAED
jgi:anti-anti-sigma regulatory factor